MEVNHLGGKRHSRKRRTSKKRSRKPSRKSRSRSRSPKRSSRKRSSRKRSSKRRGNPKMMEAMVEISGPLKEMAGKSRVKRKEIMKIVWGRINRKKLKGESGDSSDKVSYKGKNYSGGQVIHCGEDPLMKKFCGNNNKIAFVEIAKFAKKYTK